MSHTSFVGAHIPDAEWLIALWLAIHGGDPALEETVIGEEAAREAALGIIAAVAPYARAASGGADEAALAKLGITVKTRTKGEMKGHRAYVTSRGQYSLESPAATG